MAKKQAKLAVRDALRASGTVGVHTDPRSTPVGPGTKAKAAKLLAGTGKRLASLQEALYAEGTGGGTRAVLLVLQGMDTSGKGGTVKHVCGLVNPQGLHVASFKKPTRAELRHDFLWRIRRQLPAAGIIGAFDRSHYEDVLVARVDNLVSPATWQPRFDVINDFEAELAAAGTTVIKCFLHISPDEQKERLLARLRNPAKHWKHNPRDIDVRADWQSYQDAYADVLSRCSTPDAPWYVIPADRKWYRNWAVAQLLLETLEDLDPQLPDPDYDIDAEITRLTKSDPLA